MTKPERFARLAQIARGETCITCKYATESYGHVVKCEKHKAFPHLHATCICWKLTTTPNAEAAK